MKEQDRPHFGQILRNLSLVWSKEISPDVIELYWFALRGCDLRRLELAAQSMIRDREDKFFPSPKEIRIWIEDLPCFGYEQISETTIQTPEDKQRARETWGFFVFENKRFRHGIHPDDTTMWNYLMEEFRLEHSITDARAAELITIRREHGYSYLRDDPDFFSKDKKKGNVGSQIGKIKFENKER